MQEIHNVIDDCLKAAAQIQRKYFAKITESDVVTKSSAIDLRTVADTESEAAIVQRIQKAFPDHAILAEEGGAIERPEASVRWIIDPLDGTTNYSHGFPNFAISIAVEIEGRVELGAVYSPIVDERYEARRGAGATLNGRPIHVSTKEKLSDSLIVAGFPYDRHERMDRYIGFFRELMFRCHGVLRMGSAAMDLCRVASGQLEAYYEESLCSWDWAAGKLILEEASGRVTDYHGEDRCAERNQFCATNGLIHDEMLAILGPTSE